MRVVQTTLTEAEHKMLEEYAKGNSKTIKEVLREAIKSTVEGCVNSDDPLFTQLPSVKRTGKQENISEEHDRYLYSETV